MKHEIELVYRSKITLHVPDSENLSLLEILDIVEFDWNSAERVDELCTVDGEIPS